MGEKVLPLWNVKTGEHIATLKGHTSPVYSIQFSSDANMLASAGPDETIRLWDTRTYILKTTLIGHTEIITSIVFFPDDGTIATTSNIGSTRFWNTNTGKLKKTQLSFKPVTFLPDDITLISVDAGAIQFLNTNTWEENFLFIEQSENVNSVVFSPDGKTMASVGRTTLLWKLDNINLLPTKK